MATPLTVKDNAFCSEVRKAFKLFSDTEQGITVPELARKMGCQAPRLYRYMGYFVRRGEAIPDVRWTKKRMTAYYLLPKINYRTNVHHIERHPSTKKFDDLVLDLAIKKKDSGVWKAAISEMAYFCEMRRIKKTLESVGWQDGTPVSLEELHLFANRLAQEGQSRKGIKARIARIREAFGMGPPPRKRRVVRKPAAKREATPSVSLPQPHYGIIRRAFFGLGKSLKAIWRIIW